jgi:hypothetical protein
MPRFENCRSTPEQSFELPIGENCFHEGRFLPVSHDPSAHRAAAENE